MTMQYYICALLLIQAMPNCSAGFAHMHTVSLPIQSFDDVPKFKDAFDSLCQPTLLQATSMLVIVSTASQHDYALYLVTTATEYARTIYMWKDANNWHYLGTWAFISLIYLLGIFVPFRNRRDIVPERREWWETLWFTNDYRNEQYYGGWTIQMRCGDLADEWWQIQCMPNALPTKASMMSGLPDLSRARIPMCSNHMTPDAIWSLWGSWEEASPSIPMYNPNRRITNKKTMRNRRGRARGHNAYDYKVPNKFGQQVYQEWLRQGHGQDL